MEPIDHPGKLADSEDRFGKPLRFLNGRFDIKVSAVGTDGALTVIDTFRDQIGGPPLHYHRFQDEWFMVLEGEFLFRVGDRRFKCHPGDSVFGPRNVPHTFRCTKLPARMLLVFQPANRIEEFFAGGMTLAQGETAEFAALSLQHDIINIGPPIGPDDEPDP